jgi:endonuclease/exonuclease/phosphatase (EEP) superfamily protein YafD
MQTPRRERELIPYLRRSGAWTALGLVAVVLGWLIVGGLGLVVLVRAIAWDQWPFFAELDAAIEVLFLPAWLVLFGSLVRKRWRLAGAAVVICVAQVIYVAPEVLAPGQVPAAVRSEPTVRLFDANVGQHNYSMAGYITQLKAYRPEILTMEETLPGDYLQLKSAGVLATLPYHYQITCCGSRGFIIASHGPLEHVKVSYVQGLAYLIRTSLVLPKGTINLWVVHTTAPTDPGVSVWNLELDGLAKQLAKLQPRPLLMVGDFNATWGNRGFRAILATGLTDAAAARGQPFDFTWSQSLPILPPILRIDHVLTGGSVTITKIETHDGPGSDHRDITATVATTRA